ncbi:hypothetical protein [Streptomyces showdoensis]|uniref:Uncharacterized protein n=1 Tax=Streptomyces showdoensis TaxID=68268 RepID=A0A2P2GLB7_STREW|nr:hypothetical protein [Streptomyces showdoensis]KKZ72301.1 hypothetical protein VO63_19180 [Streptomyces showdoensis]
MNSIARATDNAKTNAGQTNPASSGPFDGALWVDMEGQRARYECLRPDCTHRVEGPVCATDRVPGPDGSPVRAGAARVAGFIERVKKYHLTQYHPGETAQ